MVDIHCHVLPEVDDGSRSWEMSLAMCAMAREDGIEHIVATPHSNEVYFYDRVRLQKLLDQLSEKIAHRPELSLGCDFHFSYENIQDALEKPQQFTIGNTPYLLVEFSDYSLPPSVDENLGKLIDAGLRPIITHPERNPLIQRTPERVLDWVRGGCLVQVTGSALTGRWGKTAESVTKWLFEREAVHVLASDGHNIDSRKPCLSRAREAAASLADEFVAEALTILNPRAIINGDPVPYRPRV
jgi:protein-tyrosine phosphatase